MATLLKLDRSDTATKGLIRALLNDTNLKSYKMFKPTELQQLGLNELTDGNVSVNLLIGQTNYSVKRDELEINGAAQAAQTIDQISDTLSALFLEATGGGGGGATSGSGITVVGTDVNFGRNAVPLSVDAILDTTGGFKIYMNSNADGSLFEFDQVNRVTYINGGRGNIGINSCFLGLGSGRNQTGNNVCAFGYRALNSNNKSAASAFGTSAGDTQTGSNVSLFGTLAGDHNSGSTLNAFGYTAGANNTGNQVIAIGAATGAGNARSRVILIGDAATATADDQLVFSFFRQARINFGSLTTARAYTMLDDDGIIALLKDGNGIVSDGTKLNLGGTLLAPCNLDFAGSELTFFGGGSGIKFDPINALSQLGDVSLAANGSIFSVDDTNETLKATANLVDTPAIPPTPTTEYLRIEVAGTRYFIPLHT